MSQLKPIRSKSFYPDYISEIIFAVLLSFEFLIILALLYYPLIGRQIDFSRPFQPKPEWYFLWLYQLVKYFPSNIAFIGTLLIPANFVILLMSIPFIDKGRHGRLKAIVSLTVVFLSVVVLSILSLV